MLRPDPVKDRATKEGRFQPGDPSIGLLPTKVTADWLNSIQEEIVNVIKSRPNTELDPSRVDQLYNAIVDIYRYGGDIKTAHLDNGVKHETELPFEPLNGANYKYVYFNAVSSRRTLGADITFFTSHVAVYDQQTQKWSLATQFDPAIAEITRDGIKPMIGPHLLSISSDGKLFYQTSRLDGDNYRGQLTLTHFRYVRA